MSWGEDDGRTATGLPFVVVHCRQALALQWPIFSAGDLDGDGRPASRRRLWLVAATDDADVSGPRRGPTRP
jgi:hypothetical protein